VKVYVNDGCGGIMARRRQRHGGKWSPLGGAQHDLDKSSVVNAWIDTIVVRGRQSPQRQRLVGEVKGLLWSMDSSLSWVG
jgi:hypothetical protein